MDVKDRKILEILSDNAKIPIGKLSKQVGLSREVTSYRIKRLKRHGILQRIIAKIDMTRFYQNAYSIFIRFAKLDGKFLKEAISFFAKNPYVMWVGALGGEYDISASLLTRNPNDLKVFLQQIEQQFGQNKKYDLFLFEREFKNTVRNIFSHQKQQLCEGLITELAPQKLIALDAIDKTILYALSKNAEISMARLASLVGLSEEAIRLRIRNLEKNKIICGYRGLIDLHQLGLEIYYALMRFENLTPEQEKKLETYVQLNPHYLYCAKIVGEYNLQATLWASTPQQFQSVLYDIRNTFSDMLSSFRTQLVFSEHQHTYLPPAAVLDDIDINKVNALLSF